MQNQFPEIIAVIIAGFILAVLLVGFIVTMLIVYRRKQYLHEQEILQARLEIQENIFRNLSEEIHDNIGQMLSVLKLTLSVAPITSEDEAFTYIQESKGMVNSVIASISDLSKSLHPDRIIKIGIVEAVRFELEKLEKTNLFLTSFNYEDIQVQINPENEIFLFRIIQEILNNIIKHSKAHKISVSIYRKERGIIFTFADDGVGFDVKEALQRTTSNKGIGLTSMMNRAKLLGGSLLINSEAQKGTNITIEVPAVQSHRKETIIKMGANGKEV